MLIGDRTGGIVDHMELLNRIMDEVGVQVGVDKFGEVMNEGDQAKPMLLQNAEPQGKSEIREVMFPSDFESRMCSVLV